MARRAVAYDAWMHRLALAAALVLAFAAGAAVGNGDSLVTAQPAPAPAKRPALDLPSCRRALGQRDQQLRAAQRAADDAERARLEARRAQEVLQRELQRRQGRPTIDAPSPDPLVHDLR